MTDAQNTTLTTCDCGLCLECDARGYHAEMAKYHPRNHPLDCTYHVDQYPHECTCGLLGLPVSDKAENGLDVSCETCQGNGEIVVDWDRYFNPSDGDRGDECVADCPDCDGQGITETQGELP